MNKKKMSDFFCDPKTAVKNVAMAALMVFLIVYAYFQIYPSFADKIKTETALAVSMYDSAVMDACIFRDEEAIPGGSGIHVTLVSDGERVSKGQRFANVYSAADMTELQEQIDQIDRKLEVLEKSVVETNLYVTDISKTENSIDDYMDKLISTVSDGSLDGIADTYGDLLVEMNKRELIINMTGSFNDEIARLKSERTAIESRVRATSEGLFAATSGSYYGDTDGYEKIFTMSELENISPVVFNELFAAEPDNNIKNNSYGKIVKDFVWYTVCSTDIMSSAAYTVGYSYNLAFEGSEDNVIRAELVNVVKDNAEGKAVLVFRCNMTPDNFSFERKTTVKIMNNEINGYAVPKAALRVVDGNEGVYILDGDIVRFRLIDIIYQEEDYYIVSKTKLEEETDKETVNADEKVYKYISLYDSIIVGGKNLFDGKTLG